MKKMNTFAKLGIATTMAFSTITPMVAMMAPIHAEEGEMDEIMEEPVIPESNQSTVTYAPEETQPTLNMFDTHNIANLVIKVDGNLTYNGQAQEQKVKFYINDVEQTLVKDKDYTVEGNIVTDPGTYTMKIRGIKNYSGEKEFTFTVEGSKETHDILETEIALVNQLTENGKDQTQKINVSYNGEQLVEGRDYIVDGNVAKKAGDYTLTVTGIGENFTGTREMLYTVNAHKKVDLNNVNIFLANQLTENGNAQVQKVTITYHNLYLEEGIDYVLVNNVATKAGTYTMTIQAIGNDFQGTRQVNYTIAAKKADKKKEEKKQDRKEDKKDVDKEEKDQAKGGNERQNNISTDKKLEKKAIEGQETKSNTGLIAGAVAGAIALIAAAGFFFKKRA